MTNSKKKLTAGTVGPTKKANASANKARSASKKIPGYAETSVKSTGRTTRSKDGHRPLTAKITIKGQLTVPKTVREHLNLAEGDRIEFLIGIDGKVTIMAATEDIQTLKGMVPKPIKPVSVADMNAAIEHEGGTIQ